MVFREIVEWEFLNNTSQVIPVIIEIVEWEFLNNTSQVIPVIILHVLYTIIITVYNYFEMSK